MLLPPEVLVEDPLIQGTVLDVQLGVVEDACQHQVFTEVRPLLQVLMH